LVFDAGMTYLKDMNWLQKPLVLGFGGILLAAARADVAQSTGNPYHVIIDRNGFGLKPPPPPLTNAPPTNPVTPVSIKFTGITSDSTSKKAWMMIPPSGKSSNPQYLSMAEHEKQGDIEVLEINEKEGVVKILNAGQPIELNFKDNGLPTPAALPVPGVPVLPHGLPGAVPGVPTPGIVPAPGTPPPGVRPAIVTPTGLNPGASATPTASTSLRTIPARNVRTAPVETQAATQPATDPAVARILMEAAQEQQRQRGIPPPPLPPGR
jgi:hypothetical protein